MSLFIGDLYLIKTEEEKYMDKTLDFLKIIAVFRENWIKIIGKKYFFSAHNKKGSHGLIH